MAAVADFLAFAPVASLSSLSEIRSLHVSAYVEQISARFAEQTVKQRSLRHGAPAAARAGVTAKVGNHSFRGTGISVAADHEAVRSQDRQDHAGCCRADPDRVSWSR